MKTSESLKIISRLKSAFVYNKFDEDGVTDEYQRFLTKYSYQAVNSAIDAIVESDSKNVPPISALIKIIKESCKPSKLDITNPEHCEICNDKGFLIMAENESKLDNMPYQYVLHCICLVGMSMTYDGKNCKNQSPYIIPPVTKYYDDYGIEQVKKANRKKANTKEFPKIGKSMPELKPFERGDAWENL
jgi:hypothetical protein